eukprot:scaffold134850_cov35-Tisochrysis_lutea.AAC.1
MPSKPVDSHRLRMGLVCSRASRPLSASLARTDGASVMYWANAARHCGHVGIPRGLPALDHPAVERGGPLPSRIERDLPRQLVFADAQRVPEEEVAAATLVKLPPRARVERVDPHLLLKGGEEHAAVAQQIVASRNAHEQRAKQRVAQRACGDSSGESLEDSRPYQRAGGPQAERKWN